MNGYADADRRGLVEKGGFESTDLATLAHLECPLCAKGIQYKASSWDNHRHKQHVLKSFLYRISAAFVSKLPYHHLSCIKNESHETLIFFVCVCDYCHFRRFAEKGGFGKCACRINRSSEAR